MTDQELEKMKRDLKSTQETLNTALKRLEDLENYTESPRVQIRNLEGLFKTLAEEPTSIVGYQNGSLVLTEVGSTRKVYFLINGSWRYVTLT